MPKTCTIVLSARPPVRIIDKQWPIVAEVTDQDTEALAKRRWLLVVRRHADGRQIVYAEYTTARRGDYDISAGELVPAGGDVVAAIRRVATEVVGEPDLSRRCVARLPAELLH